MSFLSMWSRLPQTYPSRTACLCCLTVPTHEGIGHSSGSPEATVEALSGLCSHRKAWRGKNLTPSHSACWQSLLPCRGKAEGLHFSLAVIQQLPSCPGGHQRFPATWCSPQMVCVCSWRPAADSLTLVGLPHWIPLITTTASLDLHCLKPLVSLSRFHWQIPQKCHSSHSRSPLETRGISLEFFPLAKLLSSQSLLLCPLLPAPKGPCPSFT